MSTDSKFGNEQSPHLRFMSATIKGKEYPLSKIFSSEFDYDIPSYQRPYAWTEEQTGKLFDDIYDAYKDKER